MEPLDAIAFWECDNCGFKVTTNLVDLILCGNPYCIECDYGELSVVTYGWRLKGRIHHEL